MKKLFGDGIHDDTEAIQELIDMGGDVILPNPEKFYIISKTLEIGANTRLILPRFAEIRLAKGADCMMLRNKVKKIPVSQIPETAEAVVKFFSNHANKYSNDKEDCVKNIEISGGIWNFNNTEQSPNPLQTNDFSNPEFTGMGMLFYNVENLTFSSLTLKDPTSFAVGIDMATNFTVENIVFDFNFGNPYSINMDGIHIFGNCHYGFIRNLKGATRDDLVALNADEGSHGPISNIRVDGIFAEECHSAVRFLSSGSLISNVHVSNVFGSFYQFCIGFSKFPNTDGYFENIIIDNVFASKAERKPHFYPFPNSYIYPFVWIQKDINVKNLRISHIQRKEYNVPVPTVSIGSGTVVDNFILDDVVSENYTDSDMPILLNRGTVKKFVSRNLHCDAKSAIVNEGIIEVNVI